MAGQKIDYQQLARENPMNWLEIKPPNYVGEFRRDAEGADPWHMVFRYA